LSTTGLVFSIQRFSIHDGPGIRTTVFLKGCVLQCFWCHNPEGRRPTAEIQYFADRCIACGACVAACTSGAHAILDGSHYFFRNRCSINGHCLTTCYSGALQMAGRKMDVNQVMAEVLADRAFYESSGGGVTLSGGEPMLQNAFAGEILRRCKEAGIPTAVETCGDIPWSTLVEILPFTDLIMMDLKLMSPEAHRRATGRSNERILANAGQLALTETPLVFRTPVVPGINDTEEEIAQITVFVRGLVELRRNQGGDHLTRGSISYELLPFHRLASDKYRSLELEDSASGCGPLKRETLARLLDVATKNGVEAQIR
jgi:pyruvate formate lyase activating enzyme